MSKCRTCGNPSLGRNLCSECTTKAVAQNKARRALKRAGGLCVYCSRPALAGFTECNQCRRRRRQSRVTPRLEAVRAYGGKCACCGDDHIEFLQIDHMAGGGRQDHLSATRSIYSRLKQAGWPTGFQVLCANCNLSLGFYGYCPHRPEVQRPVLKRGYKSPDPLDGSRPTRAAVQCFLKNRMTTLVLSQPRTNLIELVSQLPQQHLTAWLGGELVAYARDGRALNTADIYAWTTVQPIYFAVRGRSPFAALADLPEMGVGTAPPAVVVEPAKMTEAEYDAWLETYDPDAPMNPKR